MSKFQKLRLFNFIATLVYLAMFTVFGLTTIVNYGDPDFETVRGDLVLFLTPASLYVIAVLFEFIEFRKNYPFLPDERAKDRGPSVFAMGASMILISMVTIGVTLGYGLLSHTPLAIIVILLIVPVVQDIVAFVELWLTKPPLIERLLGSDLFRTAP